MNTKNCILIDVFSWFFLKFIFFVWVCEEEICYLRGR